MNTKPRPLSTRVTPHDSRNGVGGPLQCCDARPKRGRAHARARARAATFAQPANGARRPRHKK
eukprot:11217014-Lingulodinium_polyedra.AAC.1